MSECFFFFKCKIKNGAKNERLDKFFFFPLGRRVGKKFVEQASTSIDAQRECRLQFGAFLLVTNSSPSARVLASIEIRIPAAGEKKKKKKGGKNY